MNDVGFIKAANHMQNRVDVFDRRKKFIALAFTFGSPLHQTSDIDQFDLRWNNLVGFGNSLQHPHAWIGHRHHAGVGLDGTERIVRRLRRLRLSQGIEDSALADVRQTNDTAVETHRCSWRGGSIDPAVRGPEANRSIP